GRRASPSRRRLRPRPARRTRRGRGGHRRRLPHRLEPRMKSFDAIIIGAGQAGVPLAGRLASEGRAVALIERKFLGGTCVNAGCKPTKTLVASARAGHIAYRAADFGVILDTPPRIDMNRVRARAQKV